MLFNWYRICTNSTTVKWEYKHSQTDSFLIFKVRNQYHSIRELRVGHFDRNSFNIINNCIIKKSLCFLQFIEKVCKVFKTKFSKLTKTFMSYRVSILTMFIMQCARIKYKNYHKCFTVTFHGTAHIKRVKCCYTHRFHLSENVADFKTINSLALKES